MNLSTTTPANIGYKKARGTAWGDNLFSQEAR